VSDADERSVGAKENIYFLHVSDMCHTSVEHCNKPNDKGVCASKSILLSINFSLEQSYKLLLQMAEKLKN
jgi:hypothetical protein